ncbi:MAG: hypothetical protein WBN68_19705 [Sedimenticolaceae bacterium]
MLAPDPVLVRRNRLKLLGIFALFLLAPLSALFAWLYVGDAGVDTTTNAGTLVSPARPLAVSGLVNADGTPLTDADLRGHWTFVLFAPGASCGERCQQQLYLTRQTRLAMNKDVSRVQRLLVFGKRPDAALSDRLAQEHADLRWVVGDNRAETLRARFRGEGFGAEGEQYFLVDPLGNLMMFYDLSVPTKGMMNDLRKLLKVSQIG